MASNDLSVVIGVFVSVTAKMPANSPQLAHGVLATLVMVFGELVELWFWVGVWWIDGVGVLMVI
jgi:hypothetical protein